MPEKKITTKAKSKELLDKARDRQRAKSKPKSPAKPKPKKEVKKTVKAEVEVIQTEKPKKKTSLPYIYAVGRRKNSTARVRFYAKDSRSEIVVNDKDYKKYFPYFEYHQIVEQPLKKVDMFGKNYISVKVSGGGVRGQAEAVRHGIARTLLKFNEEWKKTLRGEGYLTRDSRKKERKKPGLKRARRAPQWAKR
jgi:small subunit ribosomal protein S9